MNEKTLSILIVLLVLNALLSVAYLLFYLWKKQRGKAIVVSLFLFVTPVVGALFLLCAETVNFLLFRKRDDRLREEELSFSKKQVRVITDADIQKEADHVPVEEALLVSDKRSRREVFLELLKKDDYESSLDMIKEAVESDDMEISHYAATFVSNMIAQYKKKEEELRRAYEKAPSQEHLLSYIRYLCEILSYRIFSAPEQRSYLARLDELMRLLKDENPGTIDGRMLTGLMALYEGQEQEGKIEEWIPLARQMGEKDLLAAKQCLKYYYRRGDEQAFLETLDQIKGSQLELDAETLDWVRYFDGKRAEQ